MHFKDQKEKYCNFCRKKEAAFRGCCSQFNSKTYKKSLNMDKQIIRQNRKNCTVFLRDFKGGEGNE